MGLKLKKIVRNVVKKPVTKLVGGERARRRLVGGIGGTVGGFLTGGPLGAVAGGISGARGKVKPSTLRSFLQRGLGGAGAGVLASGLAPTSLGGGQGLAGPASKALFGKLGSLAKLGLGKVGGLFGGKKGLTGSDLEALRNQGYSDDDIRELASGDIGGGGFDPLALAAGGGLIAKGLSDKEESQIFEQPGGLSPEEQAQLDALGLAQQQAIGRGRQRLLTETGEQERLFGQRLAELERPELLEEARQLRGALGAQGLGMGGLEGSGAFGEAVARAQERRQRQREGELLRLFTPSRIRATELGLEEELAPTQIRGAGTERLFGLRDIAAERSFAAEQARRQRLAEQQGALIGAGGEILSRGFGDGGGGGINLGRALPKIGGGLFDIGKSLIGGIGGLFRRRPQPTFAPRVSNLGREPLFT